MRVKLAKQNKEATELPTSSTEGVLVMVGLKKKKNKSLLVRPILLLSNCQSLCLYFRMSIRQFEGLLCQVAPRLLKVAVIVTV